MGNYIGSDPEDKDEYTAENIFAYPGMGMYFLSAFAAGDFPLLMPWMVIVVASTLMFNLLADVSYAFLDPRIRLD